MGKKKSSVDKAGLLLPFRSPLSPAIAVVDIEECAGDELLISLLPSIILIFLENSLSQTHTRKIPNFQYTFEFGFISFWLSLPKVLIFIQRLTP